MEEAAFVLAEVLSAHEEAVAFLERNGRLWLAAEMAEARNLPPGLLVRQWFLAGDRERAFWIARRTGAFADAVTRLERTRNQEEAEALRLLWAAGLAEAGDYSAAVDTIWPIPEARHMAQEWMDRAIEQGGTLGWPHAGAQGDAPAGPVRGGAGPGPGHPGELAGGRGDAAAGLRGGALPGTPDAGRADARPRRRARRGPRLGAVRSAHVARPLPPARGLRGRRRAQGRRARPAAARPRALDRRDIVWKIEIAGTDAGTMPAWDAAFLPNGLTAEPWARPAAPASHAPAGPWRTSISRPTAWWCPTWRPGHHPGPPRRGRALARLDLASRRAEPWCDARFEAFAPDYDGALWYVISPDGLIAVDATSRRFDGPWGVPVHGKVLALARSVSRCSLVTGGEDPEALTYEVPALQLRSRVEVPITARGRVGGARQLAVAPDGSVAEQWVSAAVLQLKLHGAPPLQIPLPGEDWEPGELVLSGDWLVGSAYGPGSARVYLVHRGTRKVKGEVVLGRTRRVTLHLQVQTLNLADDRGRVLVLDLEYGQMRRDLRL